MQEVAVTPGELLADADLIDYTKGAAEKDGEEAIRAIPNPRPEDRRPKETRRPRFELIATPAEPRPAHSKPETRRPKAERRPKPEFWLCS